MPLALSSTFTCERWHCKGVKVEVCLARQNKPNIEKFKECLFKGIPMKYRPECENCIQGMKIREEVESD